MLDDLGRVLHERFDELQLEGSAEQRL
jgi:hypothetical protein